MSHLRSGSPVIIPQLFYERQFYRLLSGTILIIIMPKTNWSRILIIIYAHMFTPIRFWPITRDRVVSRCRNRDWFQSFLGGGAIKLVQLSSVEADVISHGVRGTIPIICKRRRIRSRRRLGMWEFCITLSIRTKKLTAVPFLLDCDASIFVGCVR